MLIAHLTKLIKLRLYLKRDMYVQQISADIAKTFSFKHPFVLKEDECEQPFLFCNGDFFEPNDYDTFGDFLNQEFIGLNHEARSMVPNIQDFPKYRDYLLEKKNSFLHTAILEELTLLKTEDELFANFLEKIKNEKNLQYQNIVGSLYSLIYKRLDDFLNKEFYDALFSIPLNDILELGKSLFDEEELFLLPVYDSLKEVMKKIFSLKGTRTVIIHFPSHHSSEYELCHDNTITKSTEVNFDGYSDQFDFVMNLKEALLTNGCLKILVHSPLLVPVKIGDENVFKPFFKAYAIDIEDHAPEFCDAFICEKLFTFNPITNCFVESDESIQFNSFV